MVDAAITTALKRFSISEDHQRLLFMLPVLYVAKADGKISMKESFIAGMNAPGLGVAATDPQEKKMLQSLVIQFCQKADLDDLKVATDAVNAKLSEYPEDESASIRKHIRDACLKVAEASGPIFRDKVTPEEYAMLQRIFEAI